MVTSFQCKMCGNYCRNMRRQISVPVFMAVPSSQETIGLFEWEVSKLKKEADRISVRFKARADFMENKQGKGIHLGIIPDGSRRWAKMKGIKSYDGSQSVEVMDNILKHVSEKHPEVSDLSIWALSTENLRRPEKDKKLVYELLKRKMKDLLCYPRIYEKGIKVNVVGSRWEEMPPEIRELAQAIVSETKDHNGPTLNICIGYGGKEEILNAVIGASKWLRRNPSEKKLRENVFERFLLIPKPLDIVIRTGGEKRLSGFMLYQIEYAELFFTDTLWPDFTTGELDKIMKEFSERSRRFGR